MVTKKLFHIKFFVFSGTTQDAGVSGFGIKLKLSVWIIEVLIFFRKVSSIGTSMVRVDKLRGERENKIHKSRISQFSNDIIFCSKLSM